MLRSFSCEFNDGFSPCSVPFCCWPRGGGQGWRSAFCPGPAAPLPPHLFAALPESADYVLVEADGSRGLPLKAPASHEPVIRSETDGVLGCIGLSAIGRPAGEVLFRRELLGISPEEPVTEELAVKILSSEEGTKKYTAGRLYRAVLNQCDTEERLERARRMGAGLKQRGVHGAALSWGKAVWIF